MADQVEALFNSLTSNVALRRAKLSQIYYQTIPADTLAKFKLDASPELYAQLAKLAAQKYPAALNLIQAEDALKAAAARAEKEEADARAAEEQAQAAALQAEKESSEARARAVQEQSQAMQREAEAQAALQAEKEAAEAQARAAAEEVQAMRLEAESQISAAESPTVPPVRQGPKTKFIDRPLPPQYLPKTPTPAKRKSQSPEPKAKRATSPAKGPVVKKIARAIYLDHDLANVDAVLAFCPHIRAVRVSDPGDGKPLEQLMKKNLYYRQLQLNVDLPLDQLNARLSEAYDADSGISPKDTKIIEQWFDETQGLSGRRAVIFGWNKTLTKFNELGKLGQAWPTLSEEARKPLLEKLMHEQLEFLFGGGERLLDLRQLMVNIKQAGGEIVILTNSEQCGDDKPEHQDYNPSMPSFHTLVAYFMNGIPYQNIICAGGEKAAALRGHANPSFEPACLAPPVLQSSTRAIMFDNNRHQLALVAGSCNYIKLVKIPETEDLQITPWENSALTDYVASLPTPNYYVNSMKVRSPEGEYYDPISGFNPNLEDPSSDANKLLAWLAETKSPRAVLFDWDRTLSIFDHSMVAHREDIPPDVTEEQFVNDMLLFNLGGPTRLEQMRQMFQGIPYDTQIVIVSNNPLCASTLFQKLMVPSLAGERPEPVQFVCGFFYGDNKAVALKESEDPLLNQLCAEKKKGKKKEKKDKK